MGQQQKRQREKRLLSRASTSYFNLGPRSALALHWSPKKENLRAENQRQWNDEAEKHLLWERGLVCEKAIGESGVCMKQRRETSFWVFLGG